MTTVNPLILRQLDCLRGFCLPQESATWQDKNSYDSHMFFVLTTVV